MEHVRRVGDEIPPGKEGEGDALEEGTPKYRAPERFRVGGSDADFFEEEFGLKRSVQEEMRSRRDVWIICTIYIAKSILIN